MVANSFSPQFTLHFWYDTNAHKYYVIIVVGDPTVFICSPDDHQASKMFDDDPDLSTYWQSENSVSIDGNVTEQVICFLIIM